MIPINFEYDPDFLKEEERDGYLVSEDMKKLWLTELDILNKVIQVCDKYEITYFADAGTLLGAVRHKGFIPWDDDIDIIMLRNDYDRFLEVAKEEFKYPYFIDNWQTRHTYSLTTKIKRLDCVYVNKSDRILNSKIIPCAHIDIFCMDNCPEDFHERQQLQRDVYITYETYRKNLEKFNHKYHMMSQQSYMVMKEFLKSQLKKYNSICKRYDDQDTKYVFNISFPKCSIESFKRRYREDYDESIYLPFETLTLRCPKGYERCLDIMYTYRNHISWKKPVKNLALHSQELEKIVDVDHPYTDYVKMFYDRPEDLIKI